MIDELAGRAKALAARGTSRPKTLCFFVLKMRKIMPPHFGADRFE
jgi:hypothetical protein